MGKVPPLGGLPLPVYTTQTAIGIAPCRSNLGVTLDRIPLMWSVSDEALLAGLASGDPEAAAAFVRRFQARVFGLARTIVGDAASAEEIAQEALLRAWRHAGAYDHRRGRVETWLLSITRNLAIDHLRLRRGEPIDPDSIASKEAMFMRAPEDPGGESREEVASLREALASLPGEQRRALLMATLWGYTANEISEIEGAPLGTTKSRIRSAMLKLRGELGVTNER
jgi:RNA polymerase sigma factor (sigma-70 family)